MAKRKGLNGVLKRIIQTLITLLICFACGAGVFLTYCAAYLKAIHSTPLDLPAGFTVTAHTGSGGTKANSAESIGYAISSGAQVIEFDVGVTESGVAVLRHDSDEEYTVTFAQALEMIKPTALKINIDLKVTDAVTDIDDIVNLYEMQDRVFFTGVGFGRVEIIKYYCPGISYFINYKPGAFDITNERYWENVALEIVTAGGLGINTDYIYVNETMVKVMHRHNLLVSVYTVDMDYQMQRILALSPDNITTNKVDKLLETINNW